jgi:HlyD family secretion protein
MASPSTSPAAPSPQRTGLEAVRPSSSGRSRWPLIGAAVVLLLAAGAWQLRSQAAAKSAAAVSTVKTVKAVRGVLLQTLRVTGSVAARNFSNVFAPLVQAPDAANRGLVLMHLATNGGMVKEGDIVAKIDGQSVEDHLEDVESQVLQIELDMRSLRARQDARREAMEQGVRVAKARLERTQEDTKAAAVKTEIQREQLRLSLEEAQLAYQQVQSELSLLSERQAAEWRIAELGLEAQVRHRNRHRNDLARFTVKAPRSGQVILRSLFRNGEQTQVRQGDEVFPGMVFMKVVDLNGMQMEGSVSQADSELVRIGQRALVRFDAYPGLIFDGKVEAVGMMASSNRRVNYYVRRVPVRIGLEGNDRRVIPDLTANADVVLGQDDDTLLIPREAVQESGGKSVVMVKMGEAVVPREVEIGGYSNTQASVVSGLQAGDEVAIQLDKP